MFSKKRRGIFYNMIKLPFSSLPFPVINYNLAFRHKHFNLDKHIKNTLKNRQLQQMTWSVYLLRIIKLQVHLSSFLLCTCHKLFSPFSSQTWKTLYFTFEYFILENSKFLPYFQIVHAKTLNNQSAGSGQHRYFFIFIKT